MDDRGERKLAGESDRPAEKNCSLLASDDRRLNRH